MINTPDPALSGSTVECTTDPFFMDWTGFGVLHVFGDSIMPSLRTTRTQYEIGMCDSAVGPCSDPLVVDDGPSKRAEFTA